MPLVRTRAPPSANNDGLPLPPARKCISIPPIAPEARGPCPRSKEKSPRRTGRFPPAFSAGKAPPTRSAAVLPPRDRTPWLETDGRAACSWRRGKSPCPPNPGALLHKTAPATQTCLRPDATQQPPSELQSNPRAAPHHRSTPPYTGTGSAETRG